MMMAAADAVLGLRGVDTKLTFTLDPPNTDSGYQQWLDAMRSVARLPDGMPQHFRQRLWLTLADHCLAAKGVDWARTCKMAFCDRITEDDENLGSQIIKDLHRTGWSGLESEREQVVLKRVLLGYARYNPRIGYCQGFNVIAALILEVMGYKEEPTLRVFIMLVEHVLPCDYFDQSLRALSVDMAVLRELMRHKLTKLSDHLDRLQLTSESEYEPPLTNVFTTQWFLTLFATCLPQHAVFRVWDSLMLEGSEILLRTAMSIWAKISRRIFRAKTADEFYSLMGPVSQELALMSNQQSNELMQIIYGLSDFPYPGLAELRERYTWNIQPLSSSLRLLRTQVQGILNNNDSSEDSDFENSSYACLTGFMMSPAQGGKSPSGKHHPVTDLSTLQKQYKHLKDRQKQAAVILQNACAKKGQAKGFTSFIPPPSARSGGNAAVFNHLYVGDSVNRTVVNLNGAIPVSSKTIQPRRTNGVDTKAHNDSMHKPINPFEIPPSSAQTRSREPSTCSSSYSYSTIHTPTIHQDLSMPNSSRSNTVAEYGGGSASSGDDEMSLEYSSTALPRQPGGNPFEKAPWYENAQRSKNLNRLNSMSNNSLEILMNGRPDLTYLAASGEGLRRRSRSADSRINNSMSAQRSKPEVIYRRSFSAVNLQNSKLFGHIVPKSNCKSYNRNKHSVEVNVGNSARRNAANTSLGTISSEHSNAHGNEPIAANDKIRIKHNWSEDKQHFELSLMSPAIKGATALHRRDSDLDKHYPSNNCHRDVSQNETISKKSANSRHSSSTSADNPTFSLDDRNMRGGMMPISPTNKEASDLLYGLPLNTPMSNERKSSLIARSKRMINAIPSPDHSTTQRTFNPFPKSRQSSLIQKERQMGLLSIK